ncbi:nuclease harbi1 [Elysia marginata]|uniref:Nuclease harbi1 n=1 Tax=Elysia marginata TaxID=1093978 RepID=A0AAV4IDJ2_9GAST|nr:nuclease harbi1 [Elysia marginata]
MSSVNGSAATSSREDTNSGKKVLATIWLISNRGAYRDVADRFGVNKGTLHRIVMMVCTALTNLRHDVTKWPQHRQIRVLAEEFSERCRFPGVVGAIDGTFINILGPSEDRDGYINR